MKESIGGMSLFQIVILFILLFTAIMCLTINRTKAYGIKDEVVNIIENSKSATNGNINDEDLINEIIAKLDEVGYRTTGRCGSDGWQGFTRNGTQDNNNAAFCIKRNSAADEFIKDANDKCKSGCNVASGGDYPEMYYYNVALFYKLDIPIIGNAFNFKMVSATKVLYADKTYKR